MGYFGRRHGGVCKERSMVERIEERVYYVHLYLAGVNVPGRSDIGLPGFRFRTSRFNKDKQ
jgi:hypothetical protein